MRGSVARPGRPENQCLSSKPPAIQTGAITHETACLGRICGAIPHAQGDGYQAIFGFPHLVLAPGLAIAVTMLAFTFLGDGLRDALDPRSRR